MPLTLSGCCRGVGNQLSTLYLRTVVADIVIVDIVVVAKRCALLTNRAAKRKRCGEGAVCILMAAQLALHSTAYFVTTARLF